MNQASEQIARQYAEGVLKIYRKTWDGIINNVKVYGAKGDGVTDDTAAIQSAIDNVSNAGGGVIDIPAGTYLVSSTIIVRHQVKVHGMGMRLTTIQKKIGTAGPIFKIDDTYNNYIYGVEIKGMKLVGIYTDTTNDGIYHKTPFGMNHCRFEDLWFRSIGRSAFRFEHDASGNSSGWVQYCHFENIFFGGGEVDNDGAGVKSYAIYAEGGFSTIKFVNVRSYNIAESFAYLKSKTISGHPIAPEAIIFDTCNPQNINKTEDRVTYGVQLDGTLGVTFLNCYFEDIGTSDSTKVSANLFVTGTSAGVQVFGGYCAGFMNGIYLNQGNYADIVGLSFLWSNADPTRVPTCIKMGSGFGQYSTFIGKNSVYNMAGTENTHWRYLDDSATRAIGFRDTIGNFTARDLATTKSLQLAGASADDSIYSDGFLRIRNNTFFLDTNGHLRLKRLGTPSSATDGTIMQRCISGSSVNKPNVATVHTGFCYFDTTLNKPIWVNAAGTGWVDATGTSV